MTNEPSGLLGICPTKLKTFVHTKTCTGMFTAALFIIAKTRKQPKCPFSRWMDQLCYIQTMNYDSAPKRKKYKARKRQGGDLNAYHWVEEVDGKRLHTIMVPTMWHFGKQCQKTVETLKKTRVASGWEGGERNEQSEHRGLWGHENILHDIIMMDTGHHRLNPQNELHQERTWR